MVDGDVATERDGAAPPPAQPDVADIDPIARFSGLTVGRYEVGEMLGSGGMGVVYRARDPYLSRDVALKVVRSRSKRYQAALLREAQALARLAHPNVVAAYDVGTYEGSVFIAMELLRGVSLREWNTHAHSLREKLGVVLGAARGLAAAHAAGVMHRDFTPSNVMVSSGNRVHVVDFGLARALDDGEPASLPPGPPDAEPSLTATGKVHGTPGYLAPELLLGLPIDARADQFSFAATAFYALVEQRAYVGATLGEYHDALMRGTRTPWPAFVPRAVRRVIDRALSIPAGDRFDTMADVIAALERALRRPRLVMALAGGVLLVGVVAAAVTIPVARAHEVSCALPAAAFDEAWSARRREDIARAFAIEPEATEIVRRVAARFDGVRDGWLAMSRDSCEATFVHRRQSEAVHGLRQRCLARKRAEVTALVGMLARDPLPALRKDAVTRVREVGQLEECADVAALLESAERLPPEPLRASVMGIVDGLEEAHVYFVAARNAEALERTQALVARAEQTQHAPTLARAHLELGYVLHALGRREEAQASYKRALAAATLARVPGLMARIETKLLDGLIAIDRFAEAEHVLPFIEASVMHAGSAQDRVKFHLAVAAVHASGERFTEARAALDAAEREAGVGQEQQLQIANERANLLGLAGDADGAARSYRKAIELARELRGPHHPSVLLAWSNLAAVLIEGHHHDEALEALAQARTLAPHMPPGSRQVISIDLTEATLWEAKGDFPRAIALLELAVQQFESASPGPPVGVVLRAHIRLGKALFAGGRPVDAIAHFERWLGAREAENAALDWQAEAGYWLARALWSVPSGHRRAITVATTARDRYRDAGPPFAPQRDEVDAWLAERRRGAR